MKRALPFGAGVPFPPSCDPYLCISIMGRDVVHLTRQYPNEHYSLCGRASRGNSYDRNAEVLEEFDRKLCAECAELAKEGA